MEYKDMQPIGLVRLMLTDGVITQDQAAKYFPELADSKDEKIKKEIIALLKYKYELYPKAPRYRNAPQWISWLEAQGEQQLNGTFIDADDVREEFMQEVYRILDADATNDRANQIIDAFDNLPSVVYSNQGWQTPADKVGPEFKVGQTIKKEGFNLGFTIVKIEDGFYYNDMGDYFPFTDQDNWELVEQKPSEWSEDDERILNTVIHNLRYPGVNYYKKPIEEEVKWLKSLKERCTWKPSEEQLNALHWCVMNVGGTEHQVLQELLEQLEKLKG